MIKMCVSFVMIQWKCGSFSVWIRCQNNKLTNCCLLVWSKILPILNNASSRPPHTGHVAIADAIQSIDTQHRSVESNKKGWVYDPFYMHLFTFNKKSPFVNKLIKTIIYEFIVFISLLTNRLLAIVFVGINFKPPVLYCTMVFCACFSL